MPLQIIGTSHIAKESIKEIERYIKEQKPDIVAVELDVQRAASLFKEEQKLGWNQAFSVGVKGFLFAKIGHYLQQKLGKIVGVEPGSEMKAALELAQKHKLQVAYIDQPLAVTLRRFSQELTWKERGRFVGDVITGLLFPKRQLKNSGLDQFDLRKVPTKDMITKMMQQIKVRYPSIYKVLVEDRNKYMVKQLIRIIREQPRKSILVIVGAGHKEGMEELLLKVEVV